MLLGCLPNEGRKVERCASFIFITHLQKICSGHTTQVYQVHIKMCYIYEGIPVISTMNSCEDLNIKLHVFVNCELNGGE
jgi:hypothetical protein